MNNKPSNKPSNKPNNKPNPEPKKVIAVSDINYTWNGSIEGKTKWVLEEVSFDLYEGQITALLGPNGSGKSTLMKVVAGLLPLKNRQGCSGQVVHCGFDFLSHPSYLRAQKIAYVPAELRAEFPLTAYEVVSLGHICRKSGIRAYTQADNSSQIEWAMNQAFCWELRDRDLSTLSGGERQLVIIACALVQGAKVLFLDESMSKMDLNHQALIGKTLKALAAQGWTILLVCHDMNLATEWADQGILLKGGKKIIQGPIHETVTLEQLQALYPGVSLVVSKNPATGTPKVFFGAPK